MGKKKILIVDDELDLVEGVSLRLESAGYEVFKATNGLEALKKALEVKPDLILLDVMMPEVDGFETARKLKEDLKTKMIPIIMLTAKVEIEFAEIAMKAGAVDYIVKPFNPMTLLDKVRKYC
ncbi:MAG: response regulator [Candidatus Omnitrophota bacterium]